jgi:hypothetical protein
MARTANPALLKMVSAPHGVRDMLAREDRNPIAALLDRACLQRGAVESGRRAPSLFRDRNDARRLRQLVFVSRLTKKRNFPGDDFRNGDEIAQLGSSGLSLQPLFQPF